MHQEYALLETYKDIPSLVSGLHEHRLDLVNTEAVTDLLNPTLVHKILETTGFDSLQELVSDASIPLRVQLRLAILDFVRSKPDLHFVLKDTVVVPQLVAVPIPSPLTPGSQPLSPTAIPLPGSTPISPPLSPPLNYAATNAANGQRGLDLQSQMNQMNLGPTNGDQYEKIGEALGRGAKALFKAFGHREKAQAAVVRQQVVYVEDDEQEDAEEDEVEEQQGEGYEEEDQAQQEEDDEEDGDVYANPNEDVDDREGEEEQDDDDDDDDDDDRRAPPRRRANAQYNNRDDDDEEEEED